eukprot:1182078-Prorocentrum_minimum.AAC.1
MAAGFPGNPSCPSGRPDHPPVRAGLAILQIVANVNYAAHTPRLDPHHSTGSRQSLIQTVSFVPNIQVGDREDNKAGAAAPQESQPLRRVSLWAQLKISDVHESAVPALV